MFGRAAITLGIGPDSSLLLTYGEVHRPIQASATYSELFTVTRQVAPLNCAPGAKSAIVDCLVGCCVMHETVAHMKTNARL